MSIGAVQAIQIQRFEGYADPRLPIGQWWGATTVTGDASGGIAFMQLNFSEVTTPVLNSNIYNFEAFTYSAQTQADTVGHISAANWVQPPGAGIVSFPYAIRILDTEQPSLSIASAEAYTFLTVFLGSQAQQGTAQVLTFVVFNTNLIL
ncbi:hypothetical protein LCGC14_2062960, partial [marine sediment metagenome]